jgi:hypothetical protein
LPNSPRQQIPSEFAPFLNPSVQIAATCLITAGFWAEQSRSN